MIKLSHLYLTDDGYELLKPFKYYFEDIDIDYFYAYQQETKHNNYLVYLFFNRNGIDIHNVCYDLITSKILCSHSHFFELSNLKCNPFHYIINNWYCISSGILFKMFRDLFDNFQTDFEKEFIKFYGI